MAKGYWIGHITVRDAEQYKEYVALDTPIIERFGGTFLIRGGDSDVVEGATKDRHIVIEFPDMESARACYESEDYQKVAQIRKDHADSDIVLVLGHG